MASEQNQQQKQVQFSNKNENPIIKLESQKMHLALAKKNSEISTLKKQLTEKMKYISVIEAKLIALKKLYSDASKVKQQLEASKDKNEKLEKEVNELKQKLIEQHKEFAEEKRNEATKHLTDISKLKVTIDTYIQKNLRANMTELDNEKLNIQLGELKKTNDILSKKSEQDIIHKEIQNQIKISRFKEKMIDNINNTRKEVAELDVKYMDISTKLTMLQNHQLLLQLDYQ
jgi:chromosome segregation ATPase